MTRSPDETRERIQKAAAELFAAHGFHGTKTRDIAERGKVNLAAGNYHYGSKHSLYVEVLRAQFAAIRTELERSDVNPAPGTMRRLPRAALSELLRKRIRLMLELLVGPPPSVHGTLMLREMADPTEALPVIVDEFMRPMMQELRTLIESLAPTLDEASIERCAFSIIGQAFYLRSNMQALFYMKGWRAYPRRYLDEAAEHIAEFSLGGLERLQSARKRRVAHAR